MSLQHGDQVRHILRSESGLEARWHEGGFGGSHLLDVGAGVGLGDASGDFQGDTLSVFGIDEACGDGAVLELDGVGNPPLLDGAIRIEDVGE